MFSDLTLRTKFCNLTPFDPQLGNILHQTKNLIKCVADTAVIGLPTGTYSLKDDAGNFAVLPTKSIITNVIMDFYTAYTSGGSATISLQANSAGDLKNALAVASATGLVAGIPVGTAATAVKLTAARQIKMVTAVADMLTGAANFFLEYEISN